MMQSHSSIIRKEINRSNKEYKEFSDGLNIHENTGVNKSIQEKYPYIDFEKLNELFENSTELHLGVCPSSNYDLPVKGYIFDKKEEPDDPNLIKEFYHKLILKVSEILTTIAGVNISSPAETYISGGFVTTNPPNPNGNSCNRIIIIHPEGGNNIMLDAILKACYNIGINVALDYNRISAIFSE